MSNDQQDATPTSPLPTPHANNNERICDDCLMCMVNSMGTLEEIVNKEFDTLLATVGPHKLYCMMAEMHNRFNDLVTAKAVETNNKVSGMNLVHAMMLREGIRQLIGRLLTLREAAERAAKEKALKDRAQNN